MVTPRVQGILVLARVQIFYILHFCSQSVQIL